MKQCSLFLCSGKGWQVAKKDTIMTNDLTQMRQRLKELLLQKSYREGKVKLSSGLESDFYIDGKQTTLDAEGAYLCGRLLFDLIRTGGVGIGGVGGMTLTWTMNLSRLLLFAKSPKGTGRKTISKEKATWLMVPGWPCWKMWLPLAALFYR
jgi:hypothetical protein